jgi:hypothetical protein
LLSLQLTLQRVKPGLPSLGFPGSDGHGFVPHGFKQPLTSQQVPEVHTVAGVVSLQKHCGWLMFAGSGRQSGLRPVLAVAQVLPAHGSEHVKSLPLAAHWAVQCVKLAGSPPVGHGLGEQGLAQTPLSLQHCEVLHTV